MDSKIEIFCSYARKDKVFLNDLKLHLTRLQRQGLVSLWNDTDITPGAHWEEEIENHLKTAQIILLLVSPDFMASDYCYGIELKKAIERHERKEARVIPIILRPTDWQIEPLNKLQALPKDAEPITMWQNRDAAFLDVVRGIDNAIKELSILMPLQARGPTGEVEEEVEEYEIPPIQTSRGSYEPSRPITARRAVTPRQDDTFSYEVAEDADEDEYEYPSIQPRRKIYLRDPISITRSEVPIRRPLRAYVETESSLSQANTFQKIKDVFLELIELPSSDYYKFVKLLFFLSSSINIVLFLIYAIYAISTETPIGNVLISLNGQLTTLHIVSLILFIATFIIIFFSIIGNIIEKLTDIIYDIFH